MCSLTACWSNVLRHSLQASALPLPGRCRVWCGLAHAQLLLSIVRPAHQRLAHAVAPEHGHLCMPISSARPGSATGCAPGALDDSCSIHIQLTSLVERRAELALMVCESCAAQHVADAGNTGKAEDAGSYFQVGSDLQRQRKAGEGDGQRHQGLRASH